jgi:hypothetical protein
MALVLGLLVGACGGTDPTVASSTPGSTLPTTESETIGTSASPSSTGTSGGGTCSPDGTELEIEAEDTRFDTDCLVAPADTPFTITLENADPDIPHNLAIFVDDPAENPAAEPLFRGPLLTGPGTTTYQVEPISVGTYFFHCDVHPTQMFGTFVVG